MQEFEVFVESLTRVTRFYLTKSRSLESWSDDFPFVY